MKRKIVLKGYNGNITYNKEVQLQSNYSTEKVTSSNTILFTQDVSQAKV
jgi:hypothetical protein